MNTNSNINEMRQSSQSVSQSEINNIRTYINEDIESLRQIIQQNPSIGNLIMPYIYADQGMPYKYKSHTTFESLLNALQG